MHKGKIVLILAIIFSSPLLLVAFQNLSGQCDQGDYTSCPQIGGSITDNVIHTVTVIPRILVIMVMVPVALIGHKLGLSLAPLESYVYILLPIIGFFFYWGIFALIARRFAKKADLR